MWHSLTVNLQTRFTLSTKKKYFPTWLLSVCRILKYKSQFIDWKRTVSHYLTLTCDKGLYLTQCSTVTTQSGSIKEPPQNWSPLLFINIACHGQLLTGATVPSAIREMLGRDPQETEMKPNKKKISQIRRITLNDRAMSAGLTNLFGIAR